VFLTIGLGLINLSTESNCSTLKRYESYDSILSSVHNSSQNISDDGLLNGISIDNDSGIVVNGEGRLETPNGWQRDAIAHADVQKSGFCC
jgi:hypothetical protein